MPPRRPSPAVPVTRDRALRAGQAAWADRARRGLLPDGAITAPLSARLAAHPTAWARWMRQQILTDDLVVFLWYRLLQDHRTPAHVQAGRALVRSWRTYADLLHAHPVLATQAIQILLSTITPDLPVRTRRHQVAVLAAILTAAPSGAAPRFTAEQLTSFLHAMDGDEETGDLLCPLFAAHLGLPPRLLRTAWPPRRKTQTGLSMADVRAQLADLLNGAPTIPQDLGDLPGRPAAVPPRPAATGWRFYGEYVARLLHRRLAAPHTGPEDLRWAWSHPTWRSALLLHGRTLLFDKEGSPWRTDAEVEGALEALLLVQDTFLAESHHAERVQLFAWLRRVGATAPLALWARCALALATHPPDLLAMWFLIRERLRQDPLEAWGPEDWLPWLQNENPTIRTDAMLLVSTRERVSADAVCPTTRPAAGRRPRAR